MNCPTQVKQFNKKDGKITFEYINREYLHIKIF